MEKKLEVKNLKVSFRTQGGNVKAVRDISFDLNKGETLAIVGESGSGKSVTSKAIIGILAGNSIVEGGEILYDGQDLLKISEEDFHKLRGDKISMIFQDPMSSLNPIMRVGKQLTEAMLLKGKSSQNNARNEFNGKLKYLNKYLDIVYPEQVEQNKLSCKTFDSFCIESTKLEQEYNNAYAETVSLQLAIEDLLFLIEKNQKIDYKKKLTEIQNHITKAHHPYVVIQDEKLDNLQNSLKEILANKPGHHIDEKLVPILNAISEHIKEDQKKDKPNFFTLGYYMYKNKEAVVNNMDIAELNKMTRSYLDEDFMIKFIDLGTKAIEKSFDDSIEAKKNLVAKIDELLPIFTAEVLDMKTVHETAKEIIKMVHDAINHLSVHKVSIEYSFANSFKATINAYFNGVRNNPVQQAKYDKNMAKFNKLVESGKKPTWKVVPPILVDLDLAKENITKVLMSLKNSYLHDIETKKSFDSHNTMIELIDFFKEQASKVVYKVTRQMAKANALKLLEEVGIPEPQIRYNQYPFEFSGGMRQRIVIAIALSANPDILICDEPTTALDVTIQSQILELINKIKVERNLSVIFITHDLGVVANMADRIAVMYAGKIVEYGTSDDLFYDPRHPYTWALLSSMPDLDTKEKLEAIPGTPPNMIYPPKGDAFAERNKYALEIDFEQQPPLFEVTETHFAATWLLHPNAPKVEPPKIITDRIKRMKEAQQNEQQ